MGVTSVRDTHLEEAAAMDNLDTAAKHIQDIAGITTGDVAGQCLNEKRWTQADHRERIKILRDWLKTETLYE